MSCGQSPTEFRPPSRPGNKKLKSSEELYVFDDDQSEASTLRGRKLKALHVLPPNFKKLHIPTPPKGCQNPGFMARVRKTQSAEEARHVVPGARSLPLNQDPDSQPLHYPGLQFDDQGMVLPHSILGSLEDFKSYLEAKGETELVKRIPKSQIDPPSEAPERRRSQAAEKRTELLSGYRNNQSNALQNWQTHMRQRRRQQSFLSDFFDRPVENLLMNQANHFRETQEQKELLNQVMPLIHSGHGFHVGCEFWSFPERYGDEMSGITTTLTRREKGKWEPVTHVGQPRSIQQESGILCADTRRPASRTWDQSSYLQHRCQDLREVLQDIDIKKPDMDGLEVMGTGRPSTFVRACCSPSLEKKEEENKHKEMKEDPDPLAQYDDVPSDTLIPVLRFCGQLASWTGNSTSNKDKVGISATIIFEALTEEIASSHLELRNDGSTAIFYNWQQLPVPHSFPHLCPQRKSVNFYFNSSSGLILPGDTKRIEFIFQPKEPGIKMEVWQLNTHPVLLQGASMQVTLRGVARYQDKTADQRLFIEKKLEKIVTVKLCRSIVCEILQGVHTPERPSSPAELYITQDREFLSKNPKLQYHDEPVEQLKRLWQAVNPRCSWDLSVDSLRQVVLSLSEPELAQEKNLAQLNSQLLQLCEPSEPQHHLTAAAIGRHLWRKLLDMMVNEAAWLRGLLGISKRDTWTAKEDEPQISDADMADNEDVREGEATMKEEKSGSSSRFKNINKGESKSGTTEKSMKERTNKEGKDKGKRKDGAGKRLKEQLEKESASLTDTHPESDSQQPPDDKNVEIYTRLLHRKVYALMEDLLDNLCDLMDELSEREQQDTGTQ